ncbi:MAG: hypothetical protein NT128_07215 [Proteobacteria bacterium]|nr:hypothetical protein [Pseudomonadota bacterium]
MYLKIKTKKELIELVNYIENSHISWLAIDTEFFRETTYYPILSLIQISTPSQTWVIDAISCVDITPLKLTLENYNIKKIFHAGDQDWGILKQYTGAKTWPFTDTQFMAAFAKFGHGASLEKLVSEFLGVTIDKSQQKTNWLDRPLKDEQLEYAAQDAKFVASIYPILEKKLDELGRTAWVYEEMESLHHKYDNANFDKDWLKLCPKGMIKWPTPYYAYELAKWRESWAKKLDLPRRHILADAALEHVLQKNSVNHIENCACLPEVYDALKTFWENLKKDEPLTTELKTKLEQMIADHYQIFNRDQLKLIKGWQNKAKKIADELGIPVFLFLNKKQIQQLANRDSSAITGWRLEQLRKFDLLKSMKGSEGEFG